MAGLDAPTLILTILSFVSWLIAMAGTAALTADDVPAWRVGYGWWAVWFQFFLLIFVGLTAVMGSANANRLRTYLMLMVTVVWMQVADNARRALDSDPLVQGDQESATEAVLAGAILTLIFNFLYIIYWGLTDHGAQSLSLSRSAAPAQEPTKTAEAPAVAPAPVETTVATV